VEPGDTTIHDQATSFRDQDLAFQQAMARAIAAGQEHAPMVGVRKDDRPLNARFVFEPIGVDRCGRSGVCAAPARASLSEAAVRTAPSCLRTNRILPTKYFAFQKKRACNQYLADYPFSPLTVGRVCEKR
jgi:hypothetical protein